MSKIDVLLPVRNGMPYIKEAISSIFAQSYSNWHLIVVNDGSTDDSAHFLNSIADPRLTIINASGIGLVNALNLGLSYVSAPYIARMDADDICDPRRFELQLKILQQNPRVGLVCSDITRINEAGQRSGIESCLYPDNGFIERGLTYRSKMKPIVHPSVMFRSALLHNVIAYRNYPYAEDRDFWLRLLPHCTIQRINFPLLYYRITSSGISRLKRREQEGSSIMASLNYHIHRTLGIDIYTEEPALWSSLLSMCQLQANHLSRGADAFDAVKLKLRHKSALSILSFGKGAACNPLTFLPSQRQRSNLKFLSDWCARISQIRDIDCSQIKM